MIKTFTCTFFGHKDFRAHFKCQKQLERTIRNILESNEYVEFLVGRTGEFDLFVASLIRKIKKEKYEEKCSLVLVLPYLSAEYIKNRKAFEAYYDEVEICEKAVKAYFKAAITERNQDMIDRADVIVCYMERNSGGTYSAVKYAKKQGKTVVNLAEDLIIPCK